MIPIVRQVQRMTPYCLGNWKSKVPRVGITAVLTSQISLKFHSTTSRFPVSGHFRKVHQMNPRMTYCKVKRQFICVTSVSEFQTSLCFHSAASHFPEKMHQMTQMILTTSTSYMCYWCPSPKFHSL